MLQMWRREKNRKKRIDSLDKIESKEQWGIDKPSKNQHIPHTHTHNQKRASKEENHDEVKRCFSQILAKCVRFNEHSQLLEFPGISSN